jgi:hypothetical protein
MFQALVVVCVLAACAFGIRLYRRTPGDAMRRLLVGATPLFLGVLIGAVSFRILQTPFWSYNGTRLAPTFGLLRGYHLYYQVGEGPLLSTLYGPVTAIFYLPATITHTPNGAVLVGSCITAIACFSSLAWLHFSCKKEPTDQTICVFGFMVSAFIVLFDPALRYSCINIHADGPGLALASGSCASIFYGERKQSNFHLFLAALLSVLAIWGKQMFVVVPAVLALYLLIAEGWSRFLRFSAYVLLVGVPSVILVMLFFGRAAFVDLVWIPGHQPWRYPSKIVAFLQSSRELTREALPWAILPFSFLLYKVTTSRLTFAAVREWLKQNPWAMLLMVGLAEVPFSISGYIKMGGDVNSFSFALFFLCAANTLMLIKLANSPSDSVRHFSCASLLALAGLLGWSEGPVILRIGASAASLSLAEQQVAYRFIRQNPEVAYFPNFPLAHLMAQGKLYHDTTGVIDRELAGLSINALQFQQYVPNMEVVAFGNEGSLWKGHDLMQEFMAAFDQKASLSELPGWTVYTNCHRRNQTRNILEISDACRPPGLRKE